MRAEVPSAWRLYAERAPGRAETLPTMGGLRRDFPFANARPWTSLKVYRGNEESSPPRKIKKPRKTRLRHPSPAVALLHPEHHVEHSDRVKVHLRGQPSHGRRVRDNARLEVRELVRVDSGPSFPFALRARLEPVDPRKAPHPDGLGAPHPRFPNNAPRRHREKKPSALFVPSCHRNRLGAGLRVAPIERDGVSRKTTPVCPSSEDLRERVLVSQAEEFRDLGKGSGHKTQLCEFEHESLSEHF